MIKIDTHQHYWEFATGDVNWINEKWEILQRCFLPEESKVEMEKVGFDYCIAVQSKHSLEENNFLLALAHRYHHIAGVVGWVDLLSNDIEQKLEAYSSDQYFKGVRHYIQDEKDSDFILNTDFINGVKALKKYDFTYDILIRPETMSRVNDFLKQVPDQKMVLDHFAKPQIVKGEIEEWKSNLKKLASHENLYCKVSGLVTEASWFLHKNEDFTPYLDAAFEAFGTDRIMIGSDWPVCKLADSYTNTMNIVLEYLEEMSSTEKEKVLGQNAIDFYGIKVEESSLAAQ